MNVEYFIAERTSRSAEGNRPNVMVRIATASVAIGVAVMIVTLAVVMGFKREIARRMTGFSSHVQVADMHTAGTAEPAPVERNAAVERLIATTDGFVSMNVYAVKGGIAKTDEGVAGLVLKGIEGDGAMSFFAENIVEGELPRTGDSVRYKDILLSRGVADRLRLAVGDKVEMLFVGADTPPRRDRFRVSGLYSTGMDEMDDAMALTDIRNVRRLMSGDSLTISGYEVMLDDFSHADGFADRLNRRLLLEGGDEAAGLMAVSVTQLFPNIFDWLKAHDVNAAVIIVIMLVVALFNMVSALLILVLERTRMIGVLKALGMTDASLRRLFLYRAAFIVAKGVVIGDLAGLALCLVQKWSGVVRLDSEGYMLSVVPIDLGWWWLLLLNVATVAVIVVMLTVPARIVASIKPDEAVRYE